MKNLTNIIITKCLNGGFKRVGISKTEELKNVKSYLREWLDEKRNADMNWINNSFEKRANPNLIMEDAKSILSLVYLYDTPIAHSEDKNIPRISRYAWGERDYHKIIKRKLKFLCKEIESLSPEIKTKYYTDDGPIMEKAWAVKSGVGWMGKNTNVINPEIGSFFFLAEILINVELEYDKPIEDLCKNCRLCIEACPTGALYDEYKLNANLCISYHTIENKNKIPEEINLNGWIFGCDICQDICPYNGKKIFTDEIIFYPKKEVFNKTYEELSQLSEEDFNVTFEGSSVKRTKYQGWKRNLNKSKPNMKTKISM